MRSRGNVNCFDAPSFSFTGGRVGAHSLRPIRAILKLSEHPPFVKRFPFLDWMRGAAVIVMIQCHAFNSYTRPEVRGEGPYVLSQFVGGMAAPLFLFMAGMTMGFQMDSLESRESSRARRWAISLRRAGYILLVAFLFRFSNWLLSFPLGTLHEMLKVDILNCMALALIVLSALAVFVARDRARYALAAGLAIAMLAPVMSYLNWDWAPAVLREYLVPVAERNRFPFFPCAAYAAFGLAAGTIVKRSAEERLERTMQWSVILGLGLVLFSLYLSNMPYSIYARSEFWANSPTLILIRVGVALLLLSAAYLWTGYVAGTGWSWMQTLGRNSLMVYWVHVMIVYGIVSAPIKRTMTAGQAAIATAVLIALMVWLSARWLEWKRGRSTGATPGAASSPSPTDWKAPSLLRRVWGSARP